MLLEFTVENYRSFGSPQTFSMIPGKERAHQENLFNLEQRDQPVLPTAAIYGANASGKSNLIRALGCMLNLVRISATRLNPGDPLPDVVPFRLDARYSSRASRWELVFVHGRRLLRYGFSATSKAVENESLLEIRPSSPDRTILERTVRGGQTTWTFAAAFDASTRTLLQERTRNNALALSAGANLNIGELPNIFDALTNGILAVDMGSPGPGAATLPFDWLGRLNRDSALRIKVEALLRDADSGIVGLNVEPARPDDAQVEAMVKGLAAATNDRVAEGFRAQLMRGGYRLSTEHRGRPGDAVRFGWNDESRGTQVLTTLAVLMLDILATGKTVVVDEFGTSLHPLLARRMIELFQNPANNKANAQLIFATHDVTLMSPALFRRDQIWQAEKNLQGETELRSLADFEQPNRPRSTEAFARNYLAGRYGGVPNFGPTLEGRPIETGAGVC